MSRKRWLFGLLGILAVVAVAGIAAATLLRTDTKRYLNSLWNARMESEAGAFTVRTETRTGDEVSRGVMEYRYETRPDGFYYKVERYTVGDDGEPTLAESSETFEDGRRVRVEGLGEFTIPDQEPISLRTLLGFLWEDLTDANVRNLASEEDGDRTRYTIEYVVKGKSGHPELADEAILAVWDRREAELLVNRETGEIEAYTWHVEGTENNEERAFRSVTFEVEFR